MIVGYTYEFSYDLDNAVWRWENAYPATAAPGGEATGFLVVTGPGAAANRLISGTANEVAVDDPDGSAGNVTLSLPATIDLGGKTSFEIPNGTSGTTDADGETYLDTNGDGGTNFSGPVIQLDAGAGAGYLFPIALPLAASQDNYIPKYDASTKTVSWEADASGGTTAWDDIADPDADATIAFAGYEQIITSTLDEASHSVLTITNTDADRAAATTILALKDNDTGDAEATYLDVIADADGTPASVFSINQNTGVVTSLPLDLNGAATIGDGGDDIKVLLQKNVSDGTWNGITMILTAHENVAFGQLVFINSDGEAALADSDAAATMPTVAIVVVAGNADAACTVLTHGVVSETDWTLTAGQRLYVSETAGGIENTLSNISDTNDVVQIVGVALGGDTILFNPSLAEAVLE
jgi:hypothetical protein